MLVFCIFYSNNYNLENTECCWYVGQYQSINKSLSVMETSTTLKVSWRMCHIITYLQ